MSAEDISVGGGGTFCSAYVVETKDGGRVYFSDEKSWLRFMRTSFEMEDETMTNETKIVDGSVVILKGGGPRMTVLHKSKESPGKWFRCAWVDQQGLFQSQELPEHALIAVRAHLENEHGPD